MKSKTMHECRECGERAPRWLGRCPACGGWGSFDAVAVSSVSAATSLVRPSTMPVAIADVSTVDVAPVPTGVAELDRVLGGGLVPGSVTLLAGEPGMGKSTLLLQALGAMAARGVPSLLVTGEESCAQVRRRAERVRALARDLSVVAETSLPTVLEHVTITEPRVLAVDSIQTLLDPELTGTPGSVTQVRECAYRLVQQAKDRGIVTLLVGHVTKDGSLAGPRVLEHVVDTVLSVDGDRGGALRMLHARKHRFGATQELGLFEMTERGLADVPDASARFLVDRRPDVAGSVIAAAVEGTRPVLVEVQALVADATGPPRRSAEGVDGGRLAQILAVLAQRAGLSVSATDVYASIAGGIEIGETGVDLAVALAVASAREGLALPADTVVLGEVGLGGEVRSVPQVDRRLAEAARLGFARAIVPPNARAAGGIRPVPVADVREAIAFVRAVPMGATAR